VTRFSLPRVFSILILLISLIAAALNLQNHTQIVAAATDSSHTDIFGTSNFQSSAIEDDLIRCRLPLCTGTEESDIIIGSFLNEQIFALDEDDKIQGNNGNDTIFGGKGDDVIAGGNGFDKLFGEDGNDALIADAEISILGPQSFENLIVDEVLIGSRFNDLLLGIGASRPPINISSSQFSINNIANPNDVFASQIPDDILSKKITLLDGGKGDDLLIGTSGNEFYIGGPGHDYFNCNEGIDVVLDFNPKEDTSDVNCDILEDLIQFRNVE
jgi:Ca2+-binding RTX toxin-like protein